LFERNIDKDNELSSESEYEEENVATNVVAAKKKRKCLANDDPVELRLLWKQKKSETEIIRETNLNRNTV